MHKIRWLLASLLAITSSVSAQNKRDEAVIQDKLKLQKNDAWIYEDFARAKNASRKLKRPLMVVFR